MKVIIEYFPISSLANFSFFLSSRYNISLYIINVFRICEKYVIAISFEWKKGRYDSFVETKNLFIQDTFMRMLKSLSGSEKREMVPIRHFLHLLFPFIKEYLPLDFP